MFPEWCVEMEGAVSKADYDAFMSDLKEYFDTNAGSFATSLASKLGLKCSCLFAQFESGMNATLARHAQRFPGGFVIKRILEEDMKAVASVPQEEAVDQYGKGLFSHVGKSRRCWPPQGYNVIMQATRDMGAREWPPGAAPARNRGGALPTQLAIVPELTVQAPVPRQALKTNS